MNFLLAFLFGGTICALGQIVLDKSKLTQADLMVILVVLGSLISTFGFFGSFRRGSIASSSCAWCSHSLWLWYRLFI